VGKLDKMEKAKDCTHPFLTLDSECKGTCPLCTAQLQYDFEGIKLPVVLKPGISLTSGNPRNLPLSIKQAIAKAAREQGIEIVIRNTGLEMGIVRGWVGAYTRTPGQRRGRPPGKKKPPPSSESIIPAAEPTAPPGVFSPSKAPVIRRHGQYRIYQF